MRSKLFNLFILLSLTLFLGCCTKKTEVVAEQPVVKHEAPVVKEEAPVVKEEYPVAKEEPKNYSSNSNYGSGECTPCPLVRLSPRADEKAALGKEYSSEVDVMPTLDASNVVVTCGLPPGVSFVRSEPPADVDGGRLTWRFDVVKKGQPEKIRMWLKANNEGNHVCCFTATAQPLYCVSTFVGRPALAIEKSGPATAMLGSMVTYNITVRNTGNSVATNVVVNDNVPEGLSHESGQKNLSFQVGTLAAGESKSMSVTLKADQGGRHCNVATATSTDVAEEVRAEACTEVKSQSMELAFRCDERVYLRNKSNNAIVVENTGQVPLTGVKVTACPENASKLTILEDSYSGGCASWTIPEVAPGEKKEIPFRATSGESGRHCVKVRVMTAEGLSKEAECCTNWQGIPAMLLEVVDDPDPVKIGDESNYTIEVTNQGTKEDTNIQITAVFPDTMQPISATDPNGQAGTISGQEVTFQAYATITPKQKIKYTIIGKGKAEGDGRLKIYLRSAFLSENGKPPVTEDESTNVY